MAEIHSTKELRTDRQTDGFSALYSRLVDYIWIGMILIIIIASQVMNLLNVSMHPYHYLQ